MPRVGELLQNRKGQVIGVITEILPHQFAVMVSGVGIVNWEDVDDFYVEKQEEYIEIYKLLDAQR